MDALLNSQTDYIGTYIIPWSINLVTAIVIFVLGRLIAKLICRLVNKLMSKANIDDILINFIGSIEPILT